MRLTAVFSDIDGTMLDSRHRVSRRTREAVAALRGKGIPFVPVSARSPSGIFPILEDCGLRCPVIAYSGALILDEKGEVLFHRGMPVEEAARILAFLEGSGFDLSWCAYSPCDWIVRDRRDPRIALEEQIVRAQSREAPLSGIRGGIVSKFLCICEPAQIAALEERLKAAFPGCSIVKSSGKLLEIMAGGVNKADAVRRFCALRGLDIREAAAFGDSYNDMEMLRAVGCGMLMGNAPAELEGAFSGPVVKSCGEDGIYFALKERGVLSG